MPMPNEAVVQKALNIARARESEDEAIDDRIRDILETALAAIWRRIQAAPSSYIMTTLEMAIFNRYRGRAQFQNETAQRAVSRFWNNSRAPNGGSPT